MLPVVAVTAVALDQKQRNVDGVPHPSHLRNQPVLFVQIVRQQLLAFQLLHHTGDHAVVFALPKQLAGHIQPLVHLTELHLGEKNNKHGSIHCALQRMGRRHLLWTLRTTHATPTMRERPLLQNRKHGERMARWNASPRTRLTLQFRHHQSASFWGGRKQGVSVEASCATTVWSKRVTFKGRLVVESFFGFLVKFVQIGNVRGLFMKVRVVVVQVAQQHPELGAPIA